MAGPWSEAILDEVRNILGDVDDAKMIAILALNPTLEEIEKAASWADGSEIKSDSEWPLKGKIGEIYDILTADLDDESHVH